MVHASQRTSDLCADFYVSQEEQRTDVDKGSTDGSTRPGPGILLKIDIFIIELAWDEISLSLTNVERKGIVER